MKIKVLIDNESIPMPRTTIKRLVQMGVIYWCGKSCKLAWGQSKQSLFAAMLANGLTT